MERGDIKLSLSAAMNIQSCSLVYEIEWQGFLLRMELHCEVNLDPRAVHPVRHLGSSFMVTPTSPFGVCLLNEGHEAAAITSSTK